MLVVGVLVVEDHRRAANGEEVAADLRQAAQVLGQDGKTYLAPLFFRPCFSFNESNKSAVRQVCSAIDLKEDPRTSPTIQQAARRRAVK